MPSEFPSHQSIENLVQVLWDRVDSMGNRSLRRFLDLYREHPGFREHPAPYLEKDLEAAHAATKPLEKIVFLLGAGASCSAGLPLAGEMIARVTKALGEDVLKRKVRESRRGVDGRRDGFMPTGSPTFEEVMSAYHNVHGKDALIQLMREAYYVKADDFRGRTLITLFNECLAHLVRERMVDFIVTLNFDELLEQSLIEDIGPTAYVRIANSAMFQWAMTHGLREPAMHGYEHADQRSPRCGCELAKAWLLKPHGTISQENTLKNLIDDIWQFEPAIGNTLQRVFENATVVVVGYSLTAADLHKILLRNALSGSLHRLFWIDPASELLPSGKKLRDVMNKVRPGAFQHIPMDANEFACSLLEALYLCPRKVKAAGGSAGQVPDGVDSHGLLPPFRHFLRAIVFRKGAVPCTFSNRFIVELIAYAVRLKGWFSSRTILRCHQVQHMLNGATVRDVISISQAPVLLKPFFWQHCRQGRAERLFFLLKTFPQSGSAADLSRQVLPCLGRTTPAQGARRKASRKQVKGWVDRASDIARRLAQQLMSLRDVTPYSDHEEIATYRNALLIPNRTVLTALDRWLKSSSGTLLAVSETGRFLVNELDATRWHIALGDYRRDWQAIQKALREQNVQIAKSGRAPERRKIEFFNDDLKYCKETVERSKKMVRDRKGRITLIPSHRKHYHFTLIKDKGVVQGIMFRRLDRQAGTSFYWVRFEIGDEGDKADGLQFKALQDYLEQRS